jgi:hypothetical protein
MSSKQERFKIAVLDDYQRVALSLADWSVLLGRPSPHLTTISRIPRPSSSGCGHSTLSA